MPRKTTLNKHLTSKLQVSSNFTLDSVADSNYQGKCDVGGFLIFEWTLGYSTTFAITYKMSIKEHISRVLWNCAAN
jgi:hypothetical protein